MIYLLDKFDFELLDLVAGQYMNFTMWEVGEDRVRRWLEHDRSRSIFSKQEVKNLFSLEKIQVGKVTKIHLQKFDKIIVWTNSSRYFVIEITGFTQ